MSGSIQDGRWRFDLARPVHLDYGYAVTSHSSQGQTADRVLVHFDLERAGALIDERMVYVAISRGRHDVRIYTSDTRHLLMALDPDRKQSQSLRHEATVSLGLSR